MLVPGQPERVNAACAVARQLSSARAGSSAALGELLEGCRQYLLLVANQTLDPSLQAKLGASDLVQETFLDAQRDFHRFVGDTQQDLLAWLRQILLHNLHDALRSYQQSTKRMVQREVSLSSEDDLLRLLRTLPAADGTPSTHLLQRERADLLRAALDELSDDHRRVVVLRNLELKSFAEIAADMERTADAVRKLWYRAIEVLADQLEASDVVR